MPLIRGDQAETAIRRAAPVNFADIARAGEELAAKSRVEAEKVVDAARKERSTLLTGAAEKGYADGFAKGHAEGLRKGREEGAAKALEEKRPELDRLLKEWARTRETFEDERDHLLSEARASVLALALALAEKVIRRTLTTDPTLVQRQIEAALELVARGSRAVITVDSAAAEGARACLPALARSLDGMQVELAVDPALPPGSCLVRTASGGEIDASIETQLDRLARSLLGESAAESEKLPAAPSVAQPAATAAQSSPVPVSTPPAAGPGAPRLKGGSQGRAA